jgi:hypothetical protein
MEFNYLNMGRDIYVAGLPVMTMALFLDKSFNPQSEPKSWIKAFAMIVFWPAILVQYAIQN